MIPLAILEAFLLYACIIHAQTVKSNHETPKQNIKFTDCFLCNLTTINALHLENKHIKSRALRSGSARPRNMYRKDRQKMESKNQIPSKSVNPEKSVQSGRFFRFSQSPKWCPRSGTESPAKTLHRYGGRVRWQ